jgi:hypothetical protein
MKKQVWFVLCMYLVMCVAGSVAVASSAPTGFAESIIALETILYGQEKSGPFVERVAAMESAVYGKTSTASVPDKLARLNKTVYDDTEKASIPLILRFAESQLLHRVETGSVISRLNKLETTLTGKQENGAILVRLENVLKTVFASGTVTMTDTVVPAKMLVKIRLLDTLNSDINKTGDKFRYEVVENVSVGSVLVIGAGIQGVGTVEKAKAAGRFGQHGKLDLVFNPATAINDGKVPLILGDRAREENKHVVAAAGASVVGLALLGPIGLVGGAFVEGKTLNIPVGTEFFVEVEVDTTVRGVSMAEPENVSVAQPAVQSQTSAVRITKR